MPLNDDQRAFRNAWIGALKSGDYAQTQGRLYDEKGFCCLGVACDVAIKGGLLQAHWVHESGVEGHYWSLLGYHGVLPTDVANLLGTDQNPAVRLTDEMIQNYGLRDMDRNPDGRIELAVLNDRIGLTFDQIAEILALPENN
jgi:hypothetical protein